MLSDLLVKQLIEKAMEGRKYSYSPYSHFAVGAAVLCENNTVYTGCNVENASYGMTNCAERTAIFKAISEGYHRFKAIAIIADTEDPCTPCGACRQVISEFHIPYIIMANVTGDYKVVSLDELMPYRFGKTELTTSLNR